MEEIFIPLIIFSFILAMVGMILHHARWKHRQKLEAGQGEGSSLRASELQELMREAVEEANAPLLARIEELGAELLHARLLPAQEERLLDGLDEPDTQAEPPRSRRVT